MTPVFTKQFFRLDTSNQAAVVEAEPRDIERNYGRFLDPDNERRARRQAARVRKKAVNYGF